MGGRAQRLEFLLIALILLVALIGGAVLTQVQPAAQPPMVTAIPLVEASPAATTQPPARPTPHPTAQPLDQPGVNQNQGDTPAVGSRLRLVLVIVAGALLLLGGMGWIIRRQWRGRQRETTTEVPPQEKQSRRWPRLPQRSLRWPRVPALKLPSLRWPRRQRLLLSRGILKRLVRAAAAWAGWLWRSRPRWRNQPAVANTTLILEGATEDAGAGMQETPERGLGHFSIQAEPETGEVSLAPQDADEGPLHQAGEEASLPTTPVVAAWTVQERVQALAQSLAGYWKQLKLESPILLFEGGATQVRVTAEIKPGEEGALTRVPALLADEGWEAAWQDQRLICDRYTDGGAVSNGPLLLPVLRTAQGRRSRTAGETVYVPMGSIHHLGIYGQAAREALHAALAGLLWMQSPSAVGLTILDRGEVSSLYQDAPHWVAPLGGTLETIKRLLHERWIGGETETMRPLIVVISEPEKTERAALVGLLRKLRLAPSAPLHVILVERSPQASAHACYAMLPALITAKADGAWLPAGGQWPKVGAGRLVLGNVLQKEGLALARDESAVAALVRSLGDKPGDLPPVLWESEVLTA